MLLDLLKTSGQIVVSKSLDYKFDPKFDHIKMVALRGRSSLSVSFKNAESVLLIQALYWLVGLGLKNVDVLLAENCPRIDK